MDIQHDARQQKFYTILEDREYSLEYNDVEPKLWEFHCSFMLNEITHLKEMEIRDKLIEYALYFMKRNNISLLESGSCHQVKDFMQRKREMEYLIRK
jgi:hypothetical protein